MAARCRIAALLTFLFAAVALGADPHDLFQRGLTAYRAGHYEIAAQLFDESSRAEPSVGAFFNLGNAEWRRGHTGRAILAWEQAAWIDPFHSGARNNLEFARKAAQLDAPYLTWYEAASSWLPPNWWAWITGMSLWLAIGAAMLPGILRARKVMWHQAVSACGLALFLLSLPAHWGVATRARLGFVLERDTPLRLTPTRDAQSETRLASGEPVRLKRAKGDYVLVATQRAQGWIEAGSLGLLLPGQIQER
jgi:tetratricopeptide (TPR) repeat protein